MAAWLYKIWNPGSAGVSGQEKGYVILSDGLLSAHGVHRYDPASQKKGEKASKGYHSCKNPETPEPGDVLSVKGLLFSGATGNFDFPAIYHAAQPGHPAGFYYRNPETGRGNGDWEATEGGEPTQLGEKSRREEGTE